LQIGILNDIYHLTIFNQIKTNVQYLKIKTKSFVKFVFFKIADLENSDGRVLSQFYDQLLIISGDSFNMKFCLCLTNLNLNILHHTKYYFRQFT